MKITHKMNYPPPLFFESKGIKKDTFNELIVESTKQEPFEKAKK